MNAKLAGKEEDSLSGILEECRLRSNCQNLRYITDIAV